MLYVHTHTCAWAHSTYHLEHILRIFPKWLQVPQRTRSWLSRSRWRCSCVASASGSPWTFAAPLRRKQRLLGLLGWWRSIWLKRGSLEEEEDVREPPCQEHSQVSDGRFRFEVAGRQGSVPWNQRHTWYLVTVKRKRRFYTVMPLKLCFETGFCRPGWART